ncbi:MULTISPECIES: OmpP1/FadL family transporter [unclassified Anaeromyxobacter]|uniref:OmpP1/FadL family transporter n=1 Tax=unclassified Anaeromyxobacter TaxID=2620896 RepID=UPI001F567627|nr:MULTISPECIES: outer membrane protein transport protein [unclassified Anaeromyxobacter]
MRKTILTALLLVPSLALASGYEVINVNPRDLALSSSAVGAQVDAGAAFINPAALSKLDGPAVSVAGSFLDIWTDWTAPSGSTSLTGSSTTRFEPVTPVNVYAGFGTKLAGRGLGVGVGFGSPFGGNQFWKDDWQGRARIIEVQRRFFGTYLTAGYEVIPQVRVGGGLVWYYGFEYLKQGIQPFPDAYGELDTKGGALTYDVSAEIQPLLSVPLTIGVDYKHKAHATLKGDGNFEVPPALEGPETQDQGVTHDVTIPNLLNLGVGYRVAKPLLVTLQWSWSRWVVYRDDTFVGDKGLTLSVPRDYRNGNVIRGGVEWEVSPTLALRLGLMRDQSGLRKTTYSPTLPDSNTTGASTGLTWAFGNRGLAANAAFFYGRRDKVTPEGTTAFPGTFQTDVVIVSAGLSWNTNLHLAGQTAPMP